MANVGVGVESPARFETKDIVKAKAQSSATVASFPARHKSQKGHDFEQVEPMTESLHRSPQGKLPSYAC